MKKFLSLILIACMSLAFAGCGPEYEDTNGENNFRLQTITNDEIIHLKTGASGLTYRETKLGGFSSSEYSSKNFNGVEQIFLTSYWGKSDAHVYIGHMNVEKGNFKLVAINNDKIIHEFALDTFSEDFYFEDIEGDFSIHVAGESAAFDFHIEVEQNNKKTAQETGQFFCWGKCFVVGV